jgi:hypothetical protein
VKKSISSPLDGVCGHRLGQVVVVQVEPLRDLSEHVARREEASVRDADAAGIIQQRRDLLLRPDPPVLQRDALLVGEPLEVVVRGVDAAAGVDDNDTFDTMIRLSGSRPFCRRFESALPQRPSSFDVRPTG